MTEPLAVGVLEERLAGLKGEAPTPPPPAEGFQYVKPLTNVADSLVSVLQNTEHRFMLYLPQIDVLTRGFGEKELILIVGFAHAGKTQLVNTALLNNRDKRILFFSLDDPAEMILTKLVCMYENISAEELEDRMKESPDETASLVRHHALVTFKNLVVIDASLPLDSMQRAIIEATQLWNGETPQAVFLDYLTLVPEGDGGGDYSTVKMKSEKIKGWVKSLPCPVIVLHQTNRGKGGPGEALTMLSASFGGEQEATMMIGVWRKIDNPDLTPQEQTLAANTITLHLMKNKRPPGRKTGPKGVDFFMDPSTGLIRQLQANDRIRSAQTVADEAAREKEVRVREARLPYKENDGTSHNYSE